MHPPHHQRHSYPGSDSLGRRSPPPSRPSRAHQYVRYEQPSPPYTGVGNNYTTDPFELPHAKRQRLSLDSRESSLRPSSSENRNSNLPGKAGDRFSESSSGGGLKEETVESPSAQPSSAGKSRRVRTGCLTCRERHLKCDEATPDCLNCRKSNRECKRGVRLNFIDVQVKNPPYIPPSTEWSVHFQDESRLIASEYHGGLKLYAPLIEKSVKLSRDAEASQSPQQMEPTRRHGDLRSIASVLATDLSPRDAHPSYQPFSGRFWQDHDRPSFGEAQLNRLRDVSSRRDSDPFTSSRKGSDPYVAATQPTQSTLQSPGGTGGLSLAALKEYFPSRTDGQHHRHSGRASNGSSRASSLIPQGATSHFAPLVRPGKEGSPDVTMTPSIDISLTEERDYLNSDEEIHLMQVFINEVAIWMDSLDNERHFSRVIPYMALKLPMLLNAVLACGVKQLALLDASYKDEKSVFYYDTSSAQLLRTLSIPERNLTECTITATVLNVYEVMDQKPIHRMNHVAGARALIRDCHWNASGRGAGTACFWLTIGMEVLSCLTSNWQMAWDPDQWGMDLSFAADMNEGGARRTGRGPDGGKARPQTGYQAQSSSAESLGGGGEEEMWLQRIVYIAARICNFRAQTPRFQEPSPHDEQIRRHSRYAEWKHLKAMCDAWNSDCPRSMRPVGYAHRQPRGKSLFPNVWLIKRAGIIGRLFYHTAMCILAQFNPLNPRESEENRAAQLHHAHQICGIAAHTRDHGVSSVAIHSLGIAGTLLVDRDEQIEVLDILTRINADTGWHIEKVKAALKRDWRWDGEGDSNMSDRDITPGPVTTLPPVAVGQAAGAAGPPANFFGVKLPSRSGSLSSTSGPLSGSLVTLPPVANIRPVNPILAHADFSLPNHPYKNWYKPPIRANPST